MPKPVPVPDELSKPFWDAVNEQRLVVQHCAACDRRQYPPERVCTECRSGDRLEWIPTSGRARIIGYTVMHDSRVRLLQADQPFNIAVVALEEDPAIRFFSHLPGTPADEVPVGATVEAIFPELSPTQRIHEWQVVR
ncbi:MAG: hypothetical protein DWI59_04405 [Chloroflexi bacterium]|nr:MAG: hypothetical protein DWI59_04405 [Chloroflexota bacterium]